MPIQKSSFLSKIKSPEQLQKILKKKRSRSVFTNGCFDLLHPGHVTYLERARKLGSLLIVALNGDDSVRRIKGPERPINTLADRMEVMAAVGCVDYVTWFDEDTPLELIRLIRPRILVKGGDWKPEQIVGSKDVLGWGGKVLSLDYIPGKSTTEIIQKARQRGSQTGPLNWEECLSKKV